MKQERESGEDGGKKKDDAIVQVRQKINTRRGEKERELLQK